MFQRKAVAALILVVIFFGSADLLAQNKVYGSNFTLGTQNMGRYSSNFGGNILADPGFVSPRYSLLNLTGQTVIGSGLALAFGFPVFAGAIALSWSKHDLVLGYSLAALSLCTYTFGAGVGVHWIAGKENKGLSFWKTVGYAGIGAGSGILLSLGASAVFKGLPEELLGLTFLTPVAGAMIYTNHIADYNPPRYMADNRRVYKDTDISFARFYNSTKVADMELMRISFSGFAEKGWHNTIVLN